MPQVSLRERLQTEVTAAMRSGDTLRRDVLRMALSAAYLVEKERRSALADEELLELIGQQVKMRRDSILAFRKGGRQDLVDKETAELGVLQEFLPPPLTEDEIRALIEDAVRTTGATSPRDMRPVMTAVLAKAGDRADGRRVSELVAQRLASADLAAHGHDAERDAAAPKA